MRIHASLTFVLLAVPALVCAQQPAKTTPKVAPKTQIADQFHRSALVIDTHADTPQRFG